MARETKADQAYRLLIERQTRRLIDDGRVALYGDPGREYFCRPRELLVPRQFRDRLVGALRDQRADEVDDKQELSLFRLPAGANAHAAAAEMRKTVGGDPAAVEPNHVLFGAPRWRGCPGRPPIPGAPIALGAGQNDGAGVLIAVVDTGQSQASLTDPWVSQHVTVGAGGVDPLDDDGDNVLDSEAAHGTFIAGVIAQVAPGADVLALKALDTDGVTDDFTAAQAVLAAQQAGAQILNLSFGGYSHSDDGTSALNRALVDADVVVVAAAGNDALQRRFYPAARPDVIGVAAMGSTDHRAAFSNFGPWVDACADGERLLSMFAEGTVQSDADGSGQPDVFATPYAYWSGTSFAAPQVAAAIAARMTQHGETAQQAAHALVGDPALPRRTGLGVRVQTNLRSNPAGVGGP